MRFNELDFRYTVKNVWLHFNDCVAGRNEEKKLVAFPVESLNKKYIR